MEGKIKARNEESKCELYILDEFNKFKYFNTEKYEDQV